MGGSLENIGARACGASDLRHFEKGSGDVEKRSVQWGVAIMIMLQWGVVIMIMLHVNVNGNKEN